MFGRGRGVLFRSLVAERQQDAKVPLRLKSVLFLLVLEL